MASQGIRNLVTLLNSGALNGTYKTSLTSNLGRQSARTLAYAKKYNSQEPSRNEREHGDTRGHFSEVNEQTNLPQQQVRGEKDATTAEDGNEPTPINMPRQVLIDELSNVCEKYKNNKNVEEILKEELSSEIAEELRPSLNKAKEMYLNALKNSGRRVPGGEAGCRRVGKLKRSHSEFLGIRTVYGDMFRDFSTSPALAAKGKKDDCEKVKKLPCLQSTEIGGKPAEGFGEKRVCEKICMPCCKPARDPPTCTFPFVAPPCKKMKPPRPSYSECKKIFPLRRVEPCECVRPIVGSCKKSKDSSACPES